VSPPDPASLARAAGRNLAAHFTWVQRQTAGMRVRESDDLVLTSCGWPCDTFNAACGARFDPGRAADRIGDALDWFAAERVPFSWWVGPGDEPPGLSTLLEDAGLLGAESELAMAAELDPLEAAPTPDELDVRRVGTEAELDAFARLLAANWSPPDEWVVRFYRAAAPVVLSASAPVRFYLGSVGEQPVATAELTLGGDVAGLYNISTLTEWRGRGFGTALTVRPLLDARAEGYRTAILQAAPAGVSIYRRVGFAPFGDIREYKPG
jgi:GNAT superfamily N-acetyltransferase